MDDTGFGGLKLDIDTTNGEIKATYHVLMEVNKNKKKGKVKVNATEIVKDEFFVV